MSDATDGSAKGEQVLCRTEGALGRITLNRPRALNALNKAMRMSISEALTAWQRDPMIYAVVIDANEGQMFCAGGDLHEMISMARDDLEAACAAAGDEYALNWQIDCYTKPIVSLIDGLCMGSGVGLTSYGTHRVAGNAYAFAMPETAIGFFPDVGATWLLGGLPDHAGLYLGLSGRPIQRADALRFGIVTHCIAAEHFDSIRDGLRDAHPVDALLDDIAETKVARASDHEWDLIGQAFAASSLAAMLEQLEGDGSPFATVLLEELRKKSPTSLAVTFRQLTNTRPEDLGESLRREYREACRFLGSADFHEGVRALLVDKDNNPQWYPSDPADVTAAVVDAYFAMPESGDLVLPPRPQAIAAIV